MPISSARIVPRLHMPAEIRTRPPVDRARFLAEILPTGEPVVLKGQVATWPIVACGTDAALCAHIAARAGPAPVELWVGPPALRGRYGFAPDFAAENFDRKLAPLAEICALLPRAAAEPAAPSMFAGAINLAAHAPALLDEAPMPLLADDQERLTSLWIGTPGQTAAHCDLPHNLSCVVHGRRRYLLFPPDQIGNLYLGPIDRTLAGQATSLVDGEAPDLARFPRYATALAAAQQATLDPGDALYIPAMWFHHVVSPSPIGAQINVWWRLNNAETLSPMSTLNHALLTLRDLPDSERAAWRAVFEHYIFGPREAAISHLPADAVGKLAPMTPPRELHLAEQLVNELVGWHNRRLKAAEQP